MAHTILSQWKSTLASSEYATTLTQRDQSLNSFLEIDPGRRASDAEGPLAGIPIGVKDNIAVRGFQLSCGSKILAGHVAPYDATIVSRLISAGAVPVGKTNLDEFGMGSSTEMSASGPTNNPWDLSRVAGGSSGGSAAAVAAGLVPLAIGTDTGGSVRQPAAFCGVYGLKPTYGTLSRYGLVAYASSLEVAGLITTDIDLLETAFWLGTGQDVMDQTSTEHPKSGSGEVSTVGILSGDLELDPPTEAAYKNFIETVKASGISVKEVELSTLDYSVPAYYTIATAEASANLARFNGVRYGQRPIFAENPDELMRQARAEGFGSEVKLRILLGTYVLRSGFQEQYYQRAQKIRTAIRNELAELFASVDLLVLPVFPTVAFTHGENGLSSFQQKLADRFTTLANLAALPALSIPAGVHEGLPVGIQAMAPAFAEDRLFSLARSMAESIPVERPPHFAASIADEISSAGNVAQGDSGTAGAES